MDNCATTLFRLQLLERLFPFILPKMFLPPTLNMKNEGRDAFSPCGEVRLILGSRIDASPKSTTGQEDRTGREESRLARRMYLSPTIVPSLPL